MKGLKKSWRRHRMAYLFLTPAFVILAILVFYPLVKGILLSFTDMDQYNMGTKFLKASYHFIGLGNYRTIFTSSEFWQITKQTVIWTFVNVFFHFSIGLFLALLLNRQFRGRTVYRILLLVPWAVPSFVSAFAWKWMYNYDYGIINLALTKLGLQPVPWLSHPTWAMVAVILTNVWLGIPFMMVTMLGGLQSIPKDLYEAAVVDGANRWQQFWRITLPLLRSVALTATLLGVIWTFNMFNIIFLVTGGGPVHSTEILVTYSYLQAFSEWKFGMASAYGVIILSFLVVFSSVYYRALHQEEKVL
ncbi:MAG: carbohydrate ABC transporter permease [Desulfitobacteriaceae bacterium]